MASLMHNSMLCVVVVQIIFFGSWMSLIRGCLLGKAKEEKEAIDKAVEHELKVNEDTWGEYFEHKKESKKK